MAIIGIDLGTTNSLVSVWKDGKIQLVPNVFGEYLTPSVVGFDQAGEVFIGKIAREMLITAPTAAFSEFKRNMGTDYLYRTAGKSYRAEELSAFVLRRLKEDAERFLGETVTEAVISVPAYFDDDRRCATKNAGKLAGLVVERLINEPSAVALKHHMGTEEMENFIVFDFGGGTLDVSLVEAFENMVEIKAVAGDNHLGGKDFDDIIVEDFCQNNGIDRFMLSAQERGSLKKEAEQLKCDLTDKNMADRTVRIGDRTYVMHMTNQNLIHISAELFRRMTQPLKKVMNDSDMDWDEIDKVILVGGSAKMPVVKQYIKSLTDVPVVVDASPDESVAIGAGIFAAVKERKGEVKDMVLADICPFSIGIELYDGTFSPIIERNDTLPCSRTGYYVTAEHYQTKMNFPIYQGENLIANENLCLGTVTIKDLPKRPKGEAGANVTFMYDINGILDIRVVSDNQSVHKVIVNKNMGLSEAEVEKRLEELQKMTLHPVEQEENRLLIEKAQRIYQESNAFTRQYIASMLRHFKQVLKHRKGRAIREEYVRFAMYLETIEQGQFDFDDFTEDFWNEADEDDAGANEDA